MGKRAPVCEREGEEREPACGYITSWVESGDRMNFMLNEEWGTLGTSPEAPASSAGVECGVPGIPYCMDCAVVCGIEERAPTSAISRYFVQTLHS